MSGLYRCTECGHLQYGPSKGYDGSYRIYMKCEGACKNWMGRPKRRAFIWHSWRP